MSGYRQPWRLIDTVGGMAKESRSVALQRSNAGVGVAQISDESEASE